MTKRLFTRGSFASRNLYWAKPLSNPPKSPFVKGGLEYGFFSPLWKRGRGGFFMAWGEAFMVHERLACAGPSVIYAPLFRGRLGIIGR